MLPRNLLPRAAYGVPVKQVGFRARLFLILLGFALIPTIVLAAAWELTVVRALPLLGTAPAMERIAATGRARDRRGADGAADAGAAGAAGRARSARSTRGCCAARQMEFLMTRRAPAVAALAALGAALLFGIVASRVAGHLSRNLSRPLSELVGWTETIGRGEPLPEGPPRKGAPEFVVLRNRMREMATELRARARRARSRRSARRRCANRRDRSRTSSRIR